MEKGGEFSDDDAIENLPSETLRELEENAYAATQRQRALSETFQQHNYHDDGYGYGQGHEQSHHVQDGLQRPSQQQRRQPLGATQARPQLYQRRSTSTTSYHDSASRSGPHRGVGTANPGLSFADTDLQYLDTGVLDDGAGPVPADQQDAIMVLDRQGEERYSAHVSAYDENADRQQPQAATAKWQRFGHDLRDNEDNNDSSTDAASAAAHDAAEAERLREQVEHLTRERETMMQELGAAKAMVETRAGEIAIIRANQAKLQQRHDEQLASLRGAMTEQVRKHQAEVEATAMESKRVTTENAFLKRDLIEETFHKKERERASRAQKKDDGKGKAAEEQAPVTPKKPKYLPYRDGFDDNELIPSPSKSGGRRSGRGTPTAQGKRKRQVVDDSPGGSMLQLSQSFGGDNDDEQGPNPVDEGESKGKQQVRQRRREDLNVRFMRSILNHRTPPNQLRDLEVFASVSFPSQPDRAFSSFILEATTASSGFSSSSSVSSHCNYAVSYAKALISLWSRALAERYYAPIGMLMGVTKFVLGLDTRRLAPPLMGKLVPVLRESVYVNGMVRFQNSPNWHLNRGQVKQTPLKELHPEVNGTEALEILYMIATSGCMDVAADNDGDGNVGQGSPFSDFWTGIRFDFVLMMLNAYQPVIDITLMLNLLSCSIQGQPVSGPSDSNNNNDNDKDNTSGDNGYYTFGPIHNTAADQRENENYIVDRAAHLLSATPSVDEGQSPCSSREITALRLEVMYFLTEVAFSSPPPWERGKGKRGNGIGLLLSHPSALARIFRAMHDELDALYAAHAEDEREMHAELVNGLTRLAYGVLHGSNASSDGGGGNDEDENGDDRIGARVQPQLNLHTVPGAVQKHLVVLTRLAFSERGVIPASASSSSSTAGTVGRRNGQGDEENGEDRADPQEEDGSSRRVNVLLEAGIDLETVEMAHEMLEEVVNPQEAEALVEVFRPGLAAGEPQEE